MNMSTMNWDRHTSRPGKHKIWRNIRAVIRPNHQRQLLHDESREKKLARFPKPNLVKTNSHWTWSPPNHPGKQNVSELESEQTWMMLRIGVPLIRDATPAPDEEARKVTPRDGGTIAFRDADRGAAERRRSPPSPDRRSSIAIPPSSHASGRFVARQDWGLKLGSVWRTTDSQNPKFRIWIGLQT